MANQLTRDDLSKFLPAGNTKLIRAFESLISSVDVSLPDQITIIAALANQALVAAVTEPDYAADAAQALQGRIAGLEALVSTAPNNEPRDLSRDFAELQAFTYGTSPWL